MIKILPSDYQHFQKAIQVADIQIRLTKRQDEYREVFNRFYDDLEKITEPAIVIVAGDVFHNKTDLSPESVKLCKDFLVNVADRLTTILISGNHDANLANKSRLDSLTPVVEAIKHPNLHYLRDSGLYAIGDVLFNNMGIFDQPEKYIKGVNIPDVYKNKYTHIVGLYHGTVDAAVNDLGYVITNKEVTCDFFDGHHIVMLGDIHKAQDLQGFSDGNPIKPIIRYCGSMIQQNHGEVFDGHGYTIWDLNSKEYEHVNLQNDFGYYTIDINKGQLVTDLSTIPPKCRLRVRCFESVVTEVKKAMMDVRDKTDLQEVVYERVPPEDDKKILVITGKDLELAELGKLDHQESLITKYLKNKLEIKDEVKIAEVISVNKHINAQLTKDSNNGAIRWKPKKFEWSNMFSYGENNVIDFSKINGLCGLFAPNRSGKSSVMSALSFCIFDKCDRTSKASEVMNIHKSGFSCKFNFEINGVDYFISREGSADRKGNVSVKTNFWKDEGGVITSLNGEKRSETNDKIREFMGTYEDFVLTTLSVQNVKNSASFIDIGHTERKDILSQFLGLGIFDKLHTVASDRLNELSVIIKTFSKDNEIDKFGKLGQVRQDLEIMLTSSDDEKVKLSDIIHELNNQIVKCTSKLIKLDESVGNWTEDQIRRSIKDLEKTYRSTINDVNTCVESQVNSIPPLQKIVEEKTHDLHEVEGKISEVEKKNISESYKSYQSSLAEYNRVKNELDRLSITIKSQEEKLNHLSKHEFDPNCPFCIKNAGENGKEAVKTKSSLGENIKKQSSLIDLLASTKKDVEAKEWVIKEQDIFTKLLTRRNRVKDEHTIAKNKITEIEKLVDQLKRKLIDNETKYNQDVKVWSDRLDKFLSNKEAIQSNFNVQVEITSLKSQLKAAQDNMKSIDKTLMEITSRIGVANTQIDQIKSKITTAESTEKEFEIYQLYVKCVCRDGIPYELICGAVPEIEREVNVILNQIVEFHAKLETDGKNVIPYIAEGDNKWTMGLSSGFERFALGLAIRVALINLSNLPRPNFLVVDEGFGTADAESLSAMPTLFGFLRSQFDFILIMSHLDSMKDMVDGTIEIRRENDFSIVNFS